MRRSRSRVVQVAAWLGVIALGSWLIAQVLDVVLLAFAGLLLAVFLRGVGDPAARLLRVKPVWGVVAAGGFVVAALVAATWLVAPRIDAQVAELSRTLPEAISRLESKLEHLSWGPALRERLQGIGSILTTRQWLTQTGGLLSTTAGAVGSLLVFLFLGLFMALEPRPYIDGLLRLFPRARRARASEILRDMGQALRHWMLGKIISMAAVGVLTWLGLTLLDVPLALSLALFAAILSFVPNFGPVLAAIPALLLGWVQGGDTFSYVLVLYVAVQTVESYVLTPFVQRQALALPPALILLAQVAMGAWAGLLGLLLATPLTAAAVILMKRGYVEGVLGDSGRSSEPPITPES